MTGLHTPYRPTQMDYVFVVLLMCFSGNLAFTTGPRQEPLLLSMCVTVVLRMVHLRRGLETRTFLWVMLSVSIILMMQLFFLDYVSITTPIGLLVKLTIGAGVIATVRFFRLAFVRVMVWLAVLSLAFYIPTVLAGMVGIKLFELAQPVANIVGAQPDGVNPRVSVLVHTFMGGEAQFRNAGIFWEAGAFSGYLLVALVLLGSIRSDLPVAIFKRWRVILTITVLTTFSTTGYLFLPFALFTSTLVAVEARGDGTNRLLWIVVFALLLIPASGVLMQLDFLGLKIQQLYLRAVNMEAGWQVSRFGAMLFDWEHIRNRPLFGWSPADPARYSLFPWLDRYATGNGFTGYMREMGIAGLLVFLVSFWVGLGKIGMTEWSRTLVFLIIVLQLNGQSYLTYPFYLGLHFIGLERNPRTELRRASNRRRYIAARGGGRFTAPTRPYRKGFEVDCL